MNKTRKFIFAVVILSQSISIFSFADEILLPTDRKKRDPFVALVDPNGKIKTGEELFPVAQKKPLSMNIVLKAILWDEKRPLAMINNKIYAEKSEISPGLILEKINPNSVFLSDNGNEVTVQLRKTDKNE